MDEPRPPPLSLSLSFPLPLFFLHLCRFFSLLFLGDGFFTHLSINGLQVDDIVEVLEQDVSGWWTGSLNGRTGIFPSNYVEEIEPDIMPVILCNVISDYVAQEADQISLRQGDTIRVDAKDPSGWWYGFNKRSQESGWFPSTFVAELSNSDAQGAETLASAGARYDSFSSDDDVESKQKGRLGAPNSLRQNEHGALGDKGINGSDESV